MSPLIPLVQGRLVTAHDVREQLNPIVYTKIRDRNEAPEYESGYKYNNCAVTQFLLGWPNGFFQLGGCLTKENT